MGNIEELEILLDGVAETFFENKIDDYDTTINSSEHEECKITIKRVKREVRIDPKTKAILNKDVKNGQYNIGNAPLLRRRGTKCLN